MAATKKFRAPKVTEDGLKPKLLIVEDEVELGRTLTRMLQGAYDVTHVTDGLEASKVLTQDSYDVVLSDIFLPGINGVELLRLIRTYDLDVPVILMTGDPARETVIEAIELGALQYLQKPLDLAVLEAALRRAVTLSKLAVMKREALTVTDHNGNLPSALLLGDRAGLSVAFARAMEKIRLVFQPIYDAKAKKIVAFEALMRSDEPSLPCPGAVLSAAERLGVIHNLGRRIRELAAEAVEDMPDEEASLFVNLHPSELQDDQLYDRDAPLTAVSHRIVLEVTERESVDSVRDMASRISRLRGMGFRVAVDDLGAGYAGLSTFAALEPEIVKIDMSLIRGIEKSVVKQRIVKSIATLCREMNMLVVAEGVETREELACVTDIGCDLIQGYFLGRPQARFIHE